MQELRQHDVIALQWSLSGFKRLRGVRGDYGDSAQNSYIKGTITIIPAPLPKQTPPKSEAFLLSGFS